MLRGRKQLSTAALDKETGQVSREEELTTGSFPYTRLKGAGLRFHCTDTSKHPRTPIKFK